MFLIVKFYTYFPKTYFTLSYITNLKGVQSGADVEYIFNFKV